MSDYFCEESICLLCGKEMKRKWDENTPYYECDCADAKHNREIQRKIERLKEQFISPKYEFTTEVKIRMVKK